MSLPYIGLDPGSGALVAGPTPLSLPPARQISLPTGPLPEGGFITGFTAFSPRYGPIAAPVLYQSGYTNSFTITITAKMLPQVCVASLPIGGQRFGGSGFTREDQARGHVVVSSTDVPGGPLYGNVSAVVVADAALVQITVDNSAAVFSAGTEVVLDVYVRYSTWPV